MHGNFSLYWNSQYFVSTGLFYVWVECVQFLVFFVYTHHLHVLKKKSIIEPMTNTTRFQVGFVFIDLFFIQNSIG